jgi:hypothetical protein
LTRRALTTDPNGPRLLSCSVSGFFYDIPQVRIVLEADEPRVSAEAGIDLVTLTAMLGHFKINMVLRYAHPRQEHQTKAPEEMAQFVIGQR